MNWVNILVGLIIAFAIIVIAVGWHMQNEEDKEDIANKVVKKIKESEELK